MLGHCYLLNLSLAHLSVPLLLTNPPPSAQVSRAVVALTWEWNQWWILNSGPYHFSYHLWHQTLTPSSREDCLLHLHLLYILTWLLIFHLCQNKGFASKKHLTHPTKSSSFNFKIQHSIGKWNTSSERVLFTFFIQTHSQNTKSHKERNVLCKLKDKLGRMLTRANPNHSREHLPLSGARRFLPQSLL